MKRVLLFIIRGYQRRISPLIPPVCRFYPSCSEYACQALEKYGLLKALGLIIYRVIRCQPFCAGGYDPVK